MLIIYMLLGEVVSLELADKADTCYILVRHFFTHAEEEIELMLSSNSLDQDRLTKKVVADLFFNCIGKISEDDTQEISSSDYKITDSHINILEFDSEKYKTEKDLEITSEQAEFLGDLFNPSEEQSSRQADSIFSPWLFFTIFVLISFGGLFYCGFSYHQKPSKLERKYK